MSRLVSRILLSIFMFPLAAVFCVFVAVVNSEFLRGNYLSQDREILLFALPGSLTWIFVAAYWYLLWRSSVKWTSQRLTNTWLAVVAALFVAVIAGFAASAFVATSDRSGFGSFIASALAIILWLIATVFIWRESPVERAQRITQSGSSTITCPACGYNLTGLTESRCPECGAKFTLDELMASQPNNKVEID